MKLRNTVNPDVDNIGESQSIEAKMSATSMRFILKLLSNIYKDPRGSIVRELTSNCFDAHKDANVEDKSVNVSYVNPYNNDGYISFRDFGNGMTPEFMENTYFVYGESTKRDKEDQFGYFGLGSKSPLSINDQYEIVSYVNGTRYHYIVYIGDNDMPTCDVLNTSETEELNGTEIRVPLNGDSYNYTKAIKTQLKYFEDVYFTGSNIDQFNDYKIVDHELFKYNTSQVFRDNIYANIAFDRVYYPIDFTKLNLKSLEIPVGIKFTKDELVPIPSREDVQYDEDTIRLIKDRIKDTLLALVEIYHNKYPKEFTNYSEYIKFRNKTPIHQFISIQYVNKYLNENFNIVNEHAEYVPLVKYGITCKRENNYREILNKLYSVSNIIRNGSNLRSSKFTDYANVLSDKLTLVSDTGEQLDVVKNKFINFATIIKPKKLNVNDKKALVRYIRSSFYVPNKTGLYSLIVTCLLSDFLNKIKRYEEVEVPQEFIDSLKSQKRVLGDDIIYYIPCTTYDFIKNKHKHESSIEEILTETINAKYTRRTRRGQYSKNVNSRRFFHLVVANTDDYYNMSIARIYCEADKHVRMIATSKTNQKKILKMSSDNLRITSLERFIAKSKHIKRLATARKILATGGVPNFDSNINLDLYNKDIGKRLERLNAYVRDETPYGYGNKHNESKTAFLSEIDKIAKLLGLIDKAKIQERDKLNLEIGSIPLISYLKHSTPRDLIMDYMKAQKFRLKVDKSKYKTFKHYDKYELQFLQELKEKRAYLKMIKDDMRERAEKHITPTNYFSKQQLNILNHNLNILNHDKIQENNLESSYKNNYKENSKQRTTPLSEINRTKRNSSISV